MKRSGLRGQLRLFSWHKCAILVAACLLGGVASVEGQTSASGPAAIEWKTPSAAQTSSSVPDAQSVLSAAAGRHAVLQFEVPVTESKKAQLLENGITLLNYVGSNAYFARVADKGVDAKAAQMTEVAAAYGIDVNWKLHPLVAWGEWPEFALFKMPGAAAGLGVSAAEEVDFAAFYLIFHPDVSLEAEGVAVLERHGGQIRDVMPSINAVVAWAPLANIEALAAEDAVQWLEPPLPRMGEVNDSNRARTQADIVNAAPYNLDGTGINVLVYDGGTARATHVDFGGRLFVRDSGTMANHPTHVSGTIGGSGAARTDRLYRGMAPGVTIQSYMFQYDGTGTFLYTNPGDLEADYNQAINTYGAVIANNSIGTNTAANGFSCTFEGDYGACDMLIDAIVRGSLGAPMRVVWANGNERGSGRCGSTYLTTAPPACAKNHITVGALNSDDDSMTSFSSWGPTDDGRIKPDVSGPGAQSGGDAGVTSCYSTSDTAYGVMSGTSMAAPTVTGLCALILQDWKAQFPSMPLPRNSTLKILLAHNAVDLGNTGPDYRFGYGSVRVQNSVDFLRTGSFRETSLVQGEDKLYYVNVPTGAPSLKATLAWDDPPGAANTVPELVNDLDIVAIAPGSGTTYYPWTLDPANPANPAVRTQADHRNNIEQVVVDSPAAGRWTIRVRGFAVAQGPQVFSICTTPLISTATRQGALVLSSNLHSCTGTVGITVSDTDLNTDPLPPQTITVTIGSTTEPAPPGETVLLTETGPDSSIFGGSITLATSDSPGVLQVTAGDTIAATYQDADDGSGNPATVSGTATVDCQGPVVSNVAVGGISISQGTVTFNTDESATSLVRYGLGSGSLTSSVSGLGIKTNHSIALTGLTSSTPYYFAVEVTDAAGNLTVDNNGGAGYTFTTARRTDYFTQLFSSSNNDTDNMKLSFHPDGSQDYYRVCRDTLSGFPTDPAGGTALTMGDNVSTAVTLTNGKVVSLYGVSYSSFYVGSNGYITFGASDTTSVASVASHLNRPRISWLFDNLNPVTGQVTWKQLADRAVVTFQGVPESGTSNSNSGQIELYFNGDITVSWLGIACTHGLAGLSWGKGVAADYQDSDLTGYESCSALSIVPREALDSSGSKGCAFTPRCMTYTLTNTAATPMDWTGTPAADWVDVAPNAGTLDAGASVTVDVCINAGADALPVGVQGNAVEFTDTGSVYVQHRGIQLTVSDPMEVTPEEGFSASGPVLGPFAPAGKPYTLTNNGCGPLDWSAAATAPWLTVTPGTGTLDAGASVTVDVSLNASANTLGVGVHEDTVTFTNTTIASAVTRPVRLEIYQAAAMPFYESFEKYPEGSVPNDPWWTLTGTGPFHTAVTTANTPKVGAKHCILDSSGSDVYARNELTLLINLAHYEHVVLAFWAMDFADDANGPPSSPFPKSGADFDGVAVSADGGSNWYEVQGLRTLTDNVYTRVAVDLDAAVAAHGLSYSSAFRIRFNQYDNYPVTTDGIGIDDISITGNLLDFGLTPPEGLSASGYMGGAFTPPSKSYTVTNQGSVDMPWTASATQPWITVSPAGDTLSPGASVDVSVAFNAAAEVLAPGTWSDTVKFTNMLSGSVQNRTVSLAVSEGLGVLPADGLTSSGYMGGPFSPDSKEYTLTNMGSVAMPWTASVNQPWITVSPAGDTLNPGASIAVTVSINPAAGTLAPGTKSGTVGFTNTLSGNVQNRTVSLTVSESLGVGPSDGYGSSGCQGGPFAPVSKTYTLTNAGTTPFDWSASSAKNWLDVQPAAGTLAAGASVPVDVSVNANANSLPAGVESNTITFTNVTSGFARTRDVTLGVNRLPDVPQNPGPADAVRGVATDTMLAWSSAGTGVVEGDPTTKAAVQARNDDERQAIAARVAGEPDQQQVGTPTVGLYPAQEFEMNVTATIRILAFVGHADQTAGGEYENTLNAIRASFTDFNVTKTTTETSAGLATELVGKDVFLIPEQESWTLSAMTMFGANLAATLNAFVAGGGTVIICDYSPSGGSAAFLNSAGLMNPAGAVSAVSYPAKVTAMHPITEGVSSAFTAMNGAVVYSSVAGADVVVSDQTLSRPMVAAKTLGKGGVALIGWDFYSYNTDMARIVANAVQWKSMTDAYDVYFDTANPPMTQVADDLTMKTMNPGILVPGRTYYWQVVAKNQYCDSRGPVWSFTTEHVAVTPADGLTSSGYVGGPFTPAGREYLLENRSGVDVPWTASAAQPWITVSPAGGTLAAGASVAVTIAPNAVANTLLPGVHAGTAALTNTLSGSIFSRNVSLTVSEGLGVTPADGLALSGYTGGPFTPTGKQYTLTNSGSVAIPWTASATQPWLTVSPSNDILDPGASAVVTVAPNAAANALVPGVLSDTVTISDTLGGTLFRRSVSLTVSEGLAVDVTDGFDAYGLVGGPFTPPRREYTLTNLGDVAMPWTASVTQPWVTVSPAGDTLAPGASVTVTVALNAAANSLAPGVVFDTLTFANTLVGTVYNRNLSLTVLDNFVYYYPLDTNPGWATQGQWQFGVPLGGGSHGLDPKSGHTGTNVYGYNLAGDYPNSMPVHALTTGALNFSNYEHVRLSFWRWLGVDSSAYDHASVEASNNGVTWTTVWSNPTTALSEASWSQQTCDISAVADGKGLVYVRWNMGTTDASVTGPGWNIDDICFSGDAVKSIEILPADGFTLSGYMGGPFSQTGKKYTLSNPGIAAVPWTASATQPWVSVSPAGGTLGPGASAVVTVALSANAVALPQGVYTDNAAFKLTLAGTEYNRDLKLTVLDPLAAPVLSPEPVATPGSTNQIDWTAVPGANAYYAEADDDPLFGSPNGNSGWLSDLSCAFSGLTDGLTYHYRVKAGASMPGAPGSWTQTARADFENPDNIPVNISTTSSPGDVVLAGVDASPVSMPLPAFGSTYSALFTRGYWFRAPASFTITGLRVPDESGQGVQNVEIIRFNGNTPPPISGSTTNAFVSLARFTNQPSATVLSVNIPVAAGDVIGILGACGTAAMASSYAADEDWWGSILGLPVPLIRIGMQYSLFSDPAHDIWQSSTGWIARIEMYYASSTGFASSGSITSKSIVPSPFHAWSTLAFSRTTPVNTTLTVDILPATGDTPIPGYAGVASGVDISAITATAIRLRANLASTDSATTPSLGDWTVMWNEPDIYAGGAWSNVESSVQDASPPTGSLTINGGDAYTANPVVTLVPGFSDGAGSGVTRMRFGNDGNQWSAWEDVGTVKTWTLESVNGCLKTVYAQCRDAAGNVSLGTISGAITLDAASPLIELTGSSPVTVECGGTYADAGATASDACAGDLTAGIVAENTVDTSVVGSYTLHYNVNDGHGNSAAEITRMVNVVDTTPPVITLLGSNPVNMAYGGTYADAGATAVDVCAGDLTGGIAVTNPVNAGMPGTYSVRYNVNDGNGNRAAEITRTVHVVDAVKPVIRRLGSATVTVQCHTSYSDAGATASDNYAGDLTDSIEVTNPVNVNVPGSYTVRYNVDDGNGNEAAEVTRTVRVADTTGPVVTLLGSATVAVEWGSVYTDAGATASDSCAGSLPVTVGGDVVDTSKLGVYTITYDANDGNGNSAAQITRIARVVDTAKPSIALLGEADVMLDCGQEYTDAGATALDAHWGGLTDDVSASGLPPAGRLGPGTWTIAYDVVDGSGNFADTVWRTVTVRDNCALTVNAVGDTLVHSTIGRRAELSVLVTGAVGPVSYQWIKTSESPVGKGIGVIPGANDATLVIDPVLSESKGRYVCTVSDAVTTVNGPVFVVAPPASSMPAAGMLGLAMIAAAMGLGCASTLRHQKR